MAQIPDSDLVKRRIGQKADPMSGAVFVKKVYSPDLSNTNAEVAQVENGEEEEDGEDEDEADEEQEQVQAPPDEFADDLVSTTTSGSSTESVLSYTCREKLMNYSCLHQTLLSV